MSLVVRGWGVAWKHQGPKAGFSGLRKLCDPASLSALHVLEETTKILRIHSKRCLKKIVSSFHLGATTLLA